MRLSDLLFLHGLIQHTIKSPGDSKPGKRIIERPTGISVTFTAVMSDSTHEIISKSPDKGGTPMKAVVIEE
jgi:hypothetical protein